MTPTQFQTVVRNLPAGCRVTLSIRYEGILGAWLARWTRDLNERYLAMEARGLQARCVKLVAEL